MANIANSTVTVGTTATLIGPSFEYQYKNTGDVTVYLGSNLVTADKTSTGGFPLEPGQVFESRNPGTTTNIYAITASGSSTVATIGNS